MEQSLVDHPVTLIIKAPNQKYTDQTISCFLDWTVGKLKTHLSKVYPSKPEEVFPTFGLSRLDQLSEKTRLSEAPWNEEYRGYRKSMFALPLKKAEEQTRP